jgi:hypothetical protein
MVAGSSYSTLWDYFGDFLRFLSSVANDPKLRSNNLKREAIKFEGIEKLVVEYCRSSKKEAKSGHSFRLTKNLKLANDSFKK